MNGIFDTHTHCSCSFDSSEPIENMCKQAQKLGLVAYGISDHCEVNRFFPDSYYNQTQNKDNPYNFKADFEKSMDSIEKAKKDFPNLNLLCGVELGQALSDVKTAEKIIAEPRLDYVIASVHEMPPLEDFYYLDYSKLDIDELLTEYFENILKLTEWGKFNILAHLTYPLRYIVKYQPNLNLSKFEDIMYETFKNMAQKDIALEINCSHKNLSDTMPGLPIIKLFKDAGGKYISLGSDAHIANNIAEGLEKGIENAVLAGFESAVYFKNHRPTTVEF